MIRVKLLSEPEYSQMRKDGTCREYHEVDFYKLLQEQGDFSDEASCHLLRTLHGDAAVEGKWYRCITPEGKPCLPAISPEAKYGLTVIANSKRGVYTNLKEFLTFIEPESHMGRAWGGRTDSPLIWDAFAEMAIDILLVYRKKDLFCGEIPVEREFILENYLRDGAPVEARVRDGWSGKCEERDGVLYVPNMFYNQKYTWYQELDELQETLRNLNCAAVPLAKGEFAMPDFRNMCGSGWDYYNGASGQLSWSEEEEEDPLRQKRILNHMDYLPDGPESRRIVYLMIEKHGDGSYRLRESISVKYPDYGELVEEILSSFTVPDGELMVLPVDVNEQLSCAADIEKAVCAFRVAGDVVETFGPEQGLLEFAALLQEARDSGRCSVPAADED